MERPMLEVHVGQAIVVPWSNGAGFSTYRVVDNPGSGPHLLEVVSECEYGGAPDGRPVEINKE